MVLFVFVIMLAERGEEEPVQFSEAGTFGESAGACAGRGHRGGNRAVDGHYGLPRERSNVLHQEISKLLFSELLSV